MQLLKEETNNSNTPYRKYFNRGEYSKSSVLRDSPTLWTSNLNTSFNRQGINWPLLLPILLVFISTLILYSKKCIDLKIIVWRLSSLKKTDSLSKRNWRKTFFRIFLLYTICITLKNSIYSVAVFIQRRSG